MLLNGGVFENRRFVSPATLALFGPGQASPVSIALPGPGTALTGVGSSQPLTTNNTNNG